MNLSLRLIHSCLMSMILCLLMTAWVTVINLGIQPGYWQAWGKAFLLAWPAAWVIAFTVGPWTMKAAVRLHGRLFGQSIS